MAIVSMKALLEAGVHFGHRTPRWNPKMKSFIFTERKGIHIIDLQQTISRLEEAYNFVRDLASQGGVVLFVGTKRQAADTIQAAAERCSMPYVNQRWLGGTLTNFQTIRQRIDYLLDLERQRDAGELERLPKKEAQQLEHLIDKLNYRVGGLKGMEDLPDAIFVTDVVQESLAVREAHKLEIPIIAMVDTNGDPDPIDYCIPSNDDAIRAIRLITNVIADAVIEGQQMREALEAEREEFEEVELVDIYDLPAAELAEDELLGPSTLEKIRAQQGEGFEVEEVEIEEVEEEISTEEEEAEAVLEPEVAEAETDAEAGPELEAEAEAPDSGEEDADEQTEEAEEAKEKEE